MKRTTWSRSASVLTALAVALLAVGCAPGNGQPSGGQSIGDPYFPHDGNTGYAVENYNLDLSYEPGADQLRGTATIAATTTQDLSSFSFDFGLDTSGVTVDGKGLRPISRPPTASWSSLRSPPLPPTSR
jgi:hypothetical protein